MIPPESSLTARQYHRRTATRGNDCRRLAAGRGEVGAWYPRLVRSFLRRSRPTATAWGSIAVGLGVLQHVSARVTRGPGYRWGTWLGAKNYLDGWVQFDGWEYLNIAKDGYWYRPAARAPVVFFPLYAMAIRLVDRMVGEPIVSGVLVSAAAGLTAAVLYRLWLDKGGVAATDRPWALAVFLVYPYGWYLYGPDLLRCDVRRPGHRRVSPRGVRSPSVGGVGRGPGNRHPPDRPGTGSGIAGAGTGTERRTGRRPAPRRAQRRLHGLPASAYRPESTVRSCTVRLAWPLAALGGVAAYSAYLGVRWGNPLLWATSHSEYSGSGPKTWFKAGFVARWLSWDDPVYTLTITAQALILLGVFLTAPSVGRRFGWGYATFVVCLGAIPSFSSRDFLGVGRYLLAAFPTAALVGELLAGRRVARVAWVPPAVSPSS